MSFESTRFVLLNMYVQHAARISAFVFVCSVGVVRLFY